MPVNSMSKEQAYQLIKNIHDQATGLTALTPIDATSFVSVANATLAAGTENALNAISQVLSRTIIAVRPYDEKFKGLQMTADQWGGIIRKINFADQDAEADPSYLLSASGAQDAVTSGESVDQYTVKKPKVLETRYVGSDVWMGSYTIYREQLKTAFENEANFGSFMAGLMTHFMNERTQWLEGVKRAILANGIASAISIGRTEAVVHLLTEYNAATGLSLTATTVMQPANFKAFNEWAFARIQEVSRLMSERSGLFQQQITGYNINRHTPVSDQRAYFNAKFLEQFSAMALADTYHDNFLRYADVEPVSYWQAIKAPMSINYKPTYVDVTGAIKTGVTAVTSDVVVGVIFDRDAMGYNIYNQSIDASPFNAKGQYYNLFSHADVQMQSDMTEKVAVFLLD